MNKVFNKYGKKSYKSIIPKRQKVKAARAALKIINAHSIAQAGAFHLQAIASQRADTASEKTAKSRAIANAILNTARSVVNTL